jgi:hypothetical protein
VKLMAKGSSEVVAGCGDDDIVIVESYVGLPVRGRRLMSAA